VLEKIVADHTREVEAEHVFPREWCVIHTGTLAESIPDCRLGCGSSRKTKTRDGYGDDDASFGKFHLDFLISVIVCNVMFA
jgi:hypothetical protein